LIRVLRGHGEWVMSAVFSRDGRRIVTASADRTARIWDADTGQLRMTLAGLTSRLNMAAISPDGSRVATAAEDGTVTVIPVEPAALLSLACDFLRPLREFARVQSRCAPYDWTGRR
jgi:WD40 repeat protein